MQVARLSLRTSMFLVWLAALLCAGTADVLNEQRLRNQVEVINEVVNADGSQSATLLWGRHTSSYVGPVPLGPCPIASISGMAFVISVVGWAVIRWRLHPGDSGTTQQG